MSDGKRYSGDGMRAPEFRVRYSYSDHMLYTNTDGVSPEIGRCVCTSAMADRVRCYVHLMRMCGDFRSRIGAAYGAGVVGLADEMLAAPQGSDECQAAFDRLWAALDCISVTESKMCMNDAAADVDELEKNMNAGGV